MRTLVIGSMVVFAASAVAQMGGHAMSGMAPAAGPVGPAAEVQGAYKRVKENSIKAAEKMPADQYLFKPHEDIRSYARVVNHISEAQGGTCSAVLGVQAPTVPPETAGKDAVVAALKASFDLCDKAYATVTDTNLADPIKGAHGTRSRIGSLWGNISHDNEQYAILSDYLRDKELAPPTSEK